MKRRITLACVCAWGVAAAGLASAAEPVSPFAGHPAAEALARVFNPASKPATPAGAALTRKDYLKIMTGNVDFFKSHQDATGAIIDPYMKREFQYSTPAFALTCAVLVNEADRKDLLQPALKAMTNSCSELATHKTADGHADFYIPMVMMARRLLKDKAPAETVADWDQNLRQLDPATSYNTKLRAMNWNIVNTSGELLRRKDGLVDEPKRDAQWAYMEESLAGHVPHLTPFGMYDDPNEPLAYDAFARIWIELFMSDGAYDGKLAPALKTFLKNGSLSTLLLQSPNGEWASGGRSAFHQWNEAETALICEIEAAEWKKAGQMDVAGALKRGAHQALASMLRWQRPSGEMWILKNRAEPDAKLGFETYSGHSQYNLLPAAMLAMAYVRADETIPETPMAAERGGYVFDLRETFHKVIAAAGGYYVEIDTGADPHYNGTGLQRIMRAGVALSPLSDSTSAERAYEPTTGPKHAMTPGVEWKEGAGWSSLAAAGLTAKGDLKITEQSQKRVAFEISYSVARRTVTEKYVVSADGVDLSTTVAGGDDGAMRALFPALVDDGKEPTGMKIDGAKAAITLRGSTLTAQLMEPAGVKMVLDGDKIPCHNGYMRALAGPLPASTKAVQWHLTLDQEK